jgi:hypothetical protein
MAESPEFQRADDSLANYTFEKGANWESDNVRTMLQWIHISAIYIDVLNEAAGYYRRIIRRNTVMNLILSTLASTVSLSQFNLKESENPELTLMLKIFFSMSTVILALSAGFLKVYQIQEKLEKSIQLQQEWTAFGSKITSEMQLPVSLRKDALFMIVKLKEVYANLMKQQGNVSGKIVSRVAARNGLRKEELTLSDLFERILKSEAERIEIEFDSVAGIKTEKSGRVFGIFKGLRSNEAKQDDERCRVSNAIMSMSSPGTSSLSKKRQSIIMIPRNAEGLEILETSETVPNTARRNSIDSVNLDVSAANTPETVTEVLAEYNGHKLFDVVQFTDDGRQREGSIIGIRKKKNGSVVIMISPLSGERKTVTIDGDAVRKVYEDNLQQGQRLKQLQHVQRLSKAKRTIEC